MVHELKMTNTSARESSADTTAEYFRLSLSKLGQLKLPITPINYTLVYYYISGKNEELNARLDELFNDDGSWSDEIAKALFSQFISFGESEKEIQLQQSMLTVVAQILGLAADISGSSAIASETLTKNSNKLAKCKDPKQILDVASQIVADTRSLVTKTKQFESSLRESSDEITILKKQLYKARKQATIDVLTGLHNRRGFDETMTRLVQENNNNAAPIFLLILDVDHFKKINDTYGHLIGDKVLKGIGQNLSKQTRESDYLSRTGGEEFAILLFNTTLEGAFNAAEGIRQSTARLRWRQSKSGLEIGQVTISIGLTKIDLHESVEQTLERCDKALYRAKSLGRDRTIVAPLPAEER